MTDRAEAEMLSINDWQKRVPGEWKYYYAWNLDKLTDHEKDILAWYMLFCHPLGYPTYMLEVRIDNVVRHILDGPSPDNFVIWALTKDNHTALHRNDPLWVVIHESDVDWHSLPLTDMARRAQTWLEKTIMPTGGPRTGTEVVFELGGEEQGFQIE